MPALAHRDNDGVVCEIEDFVEAGHQENAPHVGADGAKLEPSSLIDGDQLAQLEELGDIGRIEVGHRGEIQSDIEVGRSFDLVDDGVEVVAERRIVTRLWDLVQAAERLCPTAGLRLLGLAAKEIANAISRDGRQP